MADRPTRPRYLERIQTYCAGVAGAAIVVSGLGAAFGWGHLPPVATDPALWWLLLAFTIVVSFVALLLALALPPAYAVYRGLLTWVDRPHLAVSV